MRRRLIGGRRRLQAPSPAMVVACIALAISLGGVGYAAVLVAANSVGSRQVVNHSLRAIDFKRGQLPGDTGGGWHVRNRDDLDCVQTTLASHAIRVRVRSRIWVFAQGSYNPDPTNDLTDLGLFVRLRNAAGTRTLGVASPAWEHARTGDPVDTRLPLATGGPVFAGSDIEDTTTPVLVVGSGRYRLQLIGRLMGTCGTGINRPDFGTNQNSVYGFTLLGRG